MPSAIDLTDRVFGKLTVIALCETANPKKRKWQCSCACGGVTTAFGSDLTTGKRTSCGCSHKVRTHGDTHTKLYKIYCNMLARCKTAGVKANTNYGGRGITVCSTWLTDYAAFKLWAEEHGYTESLSLDREDNSKGYSPENCRWVTQTAQVRNRRKTQRVTSSKYIGVFWNSQKNKWATHISIDKKTHHLGFFTDEDEAAIHRNNHILNHNLKDFTLNTVEEI